MKHLVDNRRTVILLAILLPLLLVFGYVVARTGPLAPIPITVTEVKTQAIAPALFGIGIVEARYRYQIGPAITGHVLSLDAHVGDRVSAGQVIGEMNPVDMDDKVAAKAAAIKRATASVIAAEANVNDAVARKNYAQTQAGRYENLLKAHTVSAEIADAKFQEYQIARANLAANRAHLNAAQEELTMLRADYDGLKRQRANLQLVSPVDGLVVSRQVEPGSAVVAGQTVLEVIDPTSIWINVRFDQMQSTGLAAGLAADIILRSDSRRVYTGQVSRIEPMADAITEEILAKIVFHQSPASLPPIGELTEVTVTLPALPSALVLPNASIKQINGKTGVWIIEDNMPRFALVETGASSLGGMVQILKGIKEGDRVAVYSQQALSRHSRIEVTDRLLDDTI